MKNFIFETFISFWLMSILSTVVGAIGWIFDRHKIWSLLFQYGLIGLIVFLILAVIFLPDEKKEDQKDEEV